MVETETWVYTSIKKNLAMRRIKECLNPRLLEICQHTVQLSTLNATLKTYLHAPLAEHCQIGHFSKGCLLITTTSSAWATELRYSLPDLRDKLRKEADLHQLASIKIQVADSNQPINFIKTKNKTTLSSNAQAIIQTAAEQFTYLPLKQALQKLAENK